MHQFSDKTENLEFLGPNLPKNGFWGRNFENLSLDLESTLPIYLSCIPIFNQNGQLLIFWPKFGKLSNYVQYFGSNIFEGVAESWVEVGARFSNTHLE